MPECLASVASVSHLIPDDFWDRCGSGSDYKVCGKISVESGQT